MKFRLLSIWVAAFCSPGLRAAAELPALWAERVKCVVAVEYITETEIERRPTVSMGTVIDGAGTIILPLNSVDPRAAMWQLKDFKIYLPGEAASTPGEYLGQDAYTGWHFVRVAEKIRGRLTPVTAFEIELRGFDPFFNFII